MGVLLTCFSGYFAWREWRTLSELAELIEPVPEITDVTAVPTAGEVTAISSFIATLPRIGIHSATDADRRELAEESAGRDTEYRLLNTALAPDSVFAFYRTAGPRAAWAGSIQFSAFHRTTVP